MESKKSFGKRVEQILIGKGFYIVMALCAAIIGVSIWSLFRTPDQITPDESEFDAIDYAIDDWMTLVFKGMNWYGGLEGNCLVYSKDSGLRIMRPMDFDDFLERKFIESVLAC